MASKGNKGDAYECALHNNNKWAQDTARHDPKLFPTCAAGQTPQILWIGCADSRVPETTLLGLQPGDVFVHRNIANVLPPGDLSSQAVIAYAVAHLGVNHIVVCGHTSCGGAKAALANDSLGLLDAWLVPLRKLRAELVKGKDWAGLDDKEKTQRLVEANVKQGVQTMRENGDVIKGEKERGVKVHGVVYDVGSGHLKELECGEDEEAKKIRLEAFGTEAAVHRRN